MFSTEVVLLQLLWLSLASASHFYGSVVTTTVAAKRDGSGIYEVQIRNKATYDGCYYNYGPCYNGDCGVNKKIVRGQIDYSTNSPVHNRGWCETETIVTKTLTSDRPFQTREYSCCWVWLTPGHTPSWSILTFVDLGRRSDTNAPNNSPDVAILPFLRVPQNCRRTYKLISFDPDGDVVRCRYGTAKYVECYECRQHYRFLLDQAACTLQYLASGSQGVYGFELVVEDFPRNYINLVYSDGSSSYRYGLYARKKRAVTMLWSAIPANATAANTTTTTTTSTTTQIITRPSNATATSTLSATGPITFDPTAKTSIFTARSSTTVLSRSSIMPSSATVRTTPTPPVTYAASSANTNTNFASVNNIVTLAPSTISVIKTTTTAAVTSSTTTTIPPTRPKTSTPITSAVPLSTASYAAPLSQLPLQFTFQVDPPAPSCIEGEYLPRFVFPTPRNGAVILAEAEKEVEIRVKAEARYSVLDNIIMSGPLNITKHKTTTDEFAIRWTPIEENRGQYFPICFAVEFIYRSAIYQTEMRCVVINVTAALVKTVVTCLESSMIVEVEKATLPQLHHLSLSDSSNMVCSLQSHSNSTHIVAIVPLNTCGTQIEEDDDYLLFKNEITTVDNTSSVITRRHQVEIKFFCQYAKRGNVTFTFQAHRDKVTVWDKGLGQFTYGFEFFPDQRFLTMIDPQLYPLEYFVGDRIYMKIEATAAVNNTVLFVESCRATPYDTPHYKPSYSIIENGCNVDSTVVVYPTRNNKEFRFSIAAFKFIGLHDQVYISCSVLMCEAGNLNTRCSRGCQPSGLSRSRREAVTESGTHYVSQGPLRLKRSAEVSGSAGLNLNLNLVFITGCALAAVGMICGVIFYRTKKSSFKYQPLSTEEN